MPTDNTQNTASTAEKIASGVDEVFLNLVYISPFALLLLLISDQAQDLGYVVMGLSVALAVLWALPAYGTPLD